MFLAPFPMVYIFRNLFVLREYVDDINNRNESLTSKLSKQCYRYHKLRKDFSKLCYRHLESIVKYNICLKSSATRHIRTEPVFYGDLVYKFKRVIGKSSLCDQFKRIIKSFRRVGYNMDIIRQSACLVVNSITVYSYGFLFGGSGLGLNGVELWSVGWCLMLVLG